MTSLRVLVIEDSQAKYDAIAAVIAAANVAQLEVSRANTAIAAERAILYGPWTLVILDMSLNIADSALGGASGGHATLGGLAIAEKMYLLGKESPTVIVTAFDAFQARAPANPNDAVVGLEYIDDYASNVLGTFYLGYVRYSDAGWTDRLSDILLKQIGRNENTGNT